MKSLSIRHWIFILAMMVAVSFMPAYAFADESQKLPDLGESKGSLRVYLAYHDEEKEVPVGGAEFAIYQVSDMKVSGGVPSFTLTDSFKSTNIVISGMNASETAAAAKTFAKVVTDSKLNAATQVTDGSGITTFSNLDHGVYLVMQTGATGDAAKFEKITPYLVTVPLYDASANDWMYDVTAQPKESLAAPPETETPPEIETGKDEDEGENNKTGSGDDESPVPKFFKTLIDTGDTTTIVLYAGLLIAAVLGLVIVLVRRRKREQEEQ